MNYINSVSLFVVLYFSMGSLQAEYVSGKYLSTSQAAEKLVDSIFPNPEPVDHFRYLVLNHASMCLPSMKNGGSSLGENDPATGASSASDPNGSYLVWAERCSTELIRNLTSNHDWLADNVAYFTPAKKARNPQKMKDAIVIYVLRTLLGENYQTIAKNILGANPQADLTIEQLRDIYIFNKTIDAKTAEKLINLYIVRLWGYDPSVWGRSQFASLAQVREAIVNMLTQSQTPLTTFNVIQKSIYFLIIHDEFLLTE